MGILGNMFGKRGHLQDEQEQAAGPENSRELKGLLKELQCISRASFDDVSLPEESVVDRIAEIADPSALPALEKALSDMRKYKNVLETLRGRVDPSTPGSASLVIGVSRANQLIQKTEGAIARCRRTRRK